MAPQPRLQLPPLLLLLLVLLLHAVLASATGDDDSAFVAKCKARMDESGWVVLIVAPQRHRDVLFNFVWTLEVTHSMHGSQEGYLGPT